MALRKNASKSIESIFITKSILTQSLSNVSGLRGQRIGKPGNCKPGPCHLDVIVDYVNNLAADNNDNNGNDNSKHSKVADMVKANLEGNGVMFSFDKET